MKILILVAVVSVIAFMWFVVPIVYRTYQRLRLQLRTAKHRVLILTFDDGPSTVTLSVLRVLRAHNAKAVFFLSGRNIRGREAIVKQIAAEGHEVCSHGYNHLNCRKVSPFSAISDIKQCWQSIDEALVRQNGTYLFRPPYGKLSLPCLFFLIMRKVPVVYWTIDSKDIRTFEVFDTQRVARLVEKADGGVVLAHDHDPFTERRVLSSLRSVLNIAKRTGMKVVTYSELRGRSRYRLPLIRQ
jgi:peptidoglycan-N-acetylglucosamine deacetylase